MAILLKSTSAYLDKHYQRAIFYSDLIIVILLSFSAIYGGFYIYNWNNILLLFISLIIFLTFLGFFVRLILILTKNLRKHSIGYNAEIEILEFLKQLPENYYISRDPIEFKNGNIDFVVIGPTGIFAIEVKASNVKLDVKHGRLAYEGLNRHFGKDFVKQTKYSALKVSNHLKKHGMNHYVQPILVFTRASNLRQGKKKLDGTYIIRKEWLNDIILENKSFVNKDQLAKLVVCMGH